MNTRRKLWIVSSLLLIAFGLLIYQAGRIRQLKENNQLLVTQRYDRPVIIDLMKMVTRDEKPYLNLMKIRFPDDQIYACGTIRKWLGTNDDVFFDVNDIAGTVRKQF